MFCSEAWTLPKLKPYHLFRIDLCKQIKGRGASLEAPRYSRFEHAILLGRGGFW